jgi:hypothetical protein
MPDRYAPQLTKSFSRVPQEPTVATETKQARQVKWLLLMKLWLLISITSNSMSKSVAVVREALTGIGRAVAISKRGMKVPIVVMTPARLSLRELRAKEQPIESSIESVAR